MPSNRIQEEAITWVMKSQWGALAPEEEARLQAWLAADVRHQGAYVRANAMQLDITRISSLAGGRVPRRHLSWRVPAALAAGLGAVAVMAALGWSALASGDRYSSAVGEMRKVSLEDGSSIFLNTATQAVARFDRDEREIELPAGEALFEVAKDPLRPFVVRAGEVTVKAIGTAFVVRHEGERVEVIVTDGVVELTRAGAPPQRLVADQQAKVGADRAIAVQNLKRRETERQLAWQTGRMEFDGQPLSEAVAQMNRHSRRQIVVDDPALMRRPVIGIFRSVDIEAFARIAAEALDATVAEEGDVIRIAPEAK